jgi:hypothetical protein
MAAACTICAHDLRSKIDLALASGIGVKFVATRFKISRFALYRHQKAHLPPEIRALLAAKVLQRENASRAVLLEEGAGIAGGLKAIRDPLFTLFQVAIENGDWKAASTLARRLMESLEFTAKLTGELLPHATNNITNIVVSSDYQKLRSDLLAALAHHPQARRDVAALFRRVGGEAAATIEHDAAA